jgi:MerR family transcriptional regulator, light-induced transcriptional regulator
MERMLHEVDMQEQEAQRAAVDYRRPHDAAALDRTIEREIIPRLLMTHRNGAVVPRPSGTPGSGEVDQRTFRAFMTAVRSTNDQVAFDLVREMLQAGTTPEVIMMDLLAPAADTLGEMWYRDECGFVDVTVTVGRLQRILRELGQQQSLTPTRFNSPGRILVSSLPGEQHTLGLYIVAEFFYSEGWGVVIGPPTEEIASADLVEQEWFDVVAFSVSRDDALLPLRHEIAATRRKSLNPRVRILVGGHAVNEHRDAVKLLGADARATDPHEAVRIAQQLVAEATISK